MKQALEKRSTGCSLKEDLSTEAQQDKEPFSTTNLRKWEGKRAPTGLISTVTFYKTDLPALSRERQGKEQETELIMLLSSEELGQLQRGGWTLGTKGCSIPPT